MKLRTLTEFVTELNASSSKAWNPRLVRHYTTMGAINKPIHQGRQAYYDDHHVQQAKELSSLQELGVSITRAMTSDTNESYSAKPAPAAIHMVASNSLRSKPPTVGAHYGLSLSGGGRFFDNQPSLDLQGVAESLSFGAAENSLFMSGMSISDDAQVSTTLADTTATAKEPLDDLRSVIQARLQSFAHSSPTTISQGLSRALDTKKNNFEHAPPITPDSLFPAPASPADLSQPQWTRWELQPGLEIHSTAEQNNEAQQLTHYWRNNHGKKI